MICKFALRETETLTTEDLLHQPFRRVSVSPRHRVSIMPQG
jgi:hypothetical protein